MDDERGTASGEWVTVAVWASSYRPARCPDCGAAVIAYRKVSGWRVLVGRFARSVNRRGADGRLVQVFDAAAVHACGKGGKS